MRQTSCPAGIDSLNPPRRAGRPAACGKRSRSCLSLPSAVVMGDGGYGSRPGACASRGAEVSNRELGMAGEDAACSFLKRKGYRIMDRNYRCPYGEVDIVASRRGTVVFCEVKTRSGGDIEEALGAVDERRRGRLARAASHYLDAKDVTARGCRFDVIALLKSGPAWKIVHVKDAFEAGES